MFNIIIIVCHITHLISVLVNTITETQVTCSLAHSPLGVLNT